MVSALPAGSRLLAEDLSPWQEQINRLANPPRARLRQTAAQALANATFVAITFTAEDYDTDGGHSNVTNTSRYTAPIDGMYVCTAKIAYAANATGQRASIWQVNGGDVSGSQMALPAVAAVERQYPAHQLEVELFAGDYVQVMGYQDSGGSLNTSVLNALIQSVMTVRWTGELL